MNTSTLETLKAAINAIESGNAVNRWFTVKQAIAAVSAEICDQIKQQANLAQEQCKQEVRQFHLIPDVCRTEAYGTGSAVTEVHLQFNSGNRNGWQQLNPSYHWPMSLAEAESILQQLLLITPETIHQLICKQLAK